MSAAAALVTYDALGVFGTTLSEKLGGFHSSSGKVAPISPRALYT
jgi:hypothetical protein